MKSNFKTLTLTTRSSHLEVEFLSLWQRCYPELELQREVIAIPKRRFRLDFAHLPSKVGIEINGGTWIKGGHSSGSGIIRDMEKLNLHQYHGWLLFQLAQKMITVEWINKIADTIRARVQK